MATALHSVSDHCVKCQGSHHSDYPTESTCWLSTGLYGIQLSFIDRGHCEW